ncbi:MAG TPA: hypothetical protein VN690_07985 [Terriglobales bacterium]|nr:hypothetical protein [Terriglobales bacterium]
MLALLDWQLLSSLRTPGTRPTFIIGLAGLIAIAAGLAASLAEVRVESGGVRYRRLLRWHFLPFSQIRRAGRCWAVGYAVPCQPIAPWRVLFFGLGRSTRLRNPLLEAMRQGIEAGQAQRLAPREWAAPPIPAAKLAVPILLASTACLLAVFLSPSTITEPWLSGAAYSASLQHPNLALAISMPIRPPWCVATAVLDAIWARHSRHWFVAALAAGLLLGWFLAGL